MKNNYIIISLIVGLIIIFLTLLFVDIPSPSKTIKQNYQIEIK